MDFDSFDFSYSYVCKRHSVVNKKEEDEEKFKKDLSWGNYKQL